MNDLDLLKYVSDAVAERAQPGGRWDAAEGAVSNVLRVLYETAESSGGPLWGDVYEAIKSAYVGQPDWDTES